MSQRKRDTAHKKKMRLHTDALEEILHRLPSKVLLHFKLVCKDWQRLISSPEFIQKHLKRSKAEFNEPGILVPLKHTDKEILYCNANNITRNIILGDGVRLLGSCDGLVLYCNPSVDEIRALNPCTGKFEARVPNLSMELDYLVSSWFGHHPCTGEYVLVLANLLKFEETRQIMFRVYSLSRNSLLSSSTTEVNIYELTSLDTPPDYSFQKIGTLLHGRLHFQVQVDHILFPRMTIILVHDFETNNIGILPSMQSHCGFMGVVEGCLSTMRRGKRLKNELWTMKEYGVKESWTKYADLDEGNRGSKLLFPLFFCPNGDVILTDGFDEWIKYSTRDRETKLLCKAHTPITRCADTDSLVSLSFTRRAAVACKDSLVSLAFVWTKEE